MLTSPFWVRTARGRSVVGLSALWRFRCQRIVIDSASVNVNHTGLFDHLDGDLLVLSVKKCVNRYERLLERGQMAPPLKWLLG